MKHHFKLNNKSNCFANVNRHIGRTVNKKISLHDSILTVLTTANVFLKQFSQNFSINQNYQPTINSDDVSMLNRLQLF